LEYKEYMRNWDRIEDLKELKGHGFRRLLMLAHTEGLLDGLLRDIGYLDFQQDVHRLDPNADGTKK